MTIGNYLVSNQQGGFVIVTCKTSGLCFKFDATNGRAMQGRPPKSACRAARIFIQGGCRDN